MEYGAFMHRMCRSFQSLFEWVLNKSMFEANKQKGTIFAYVAFLCRPFGSRLKAQCSEPKSHPWLRAQALRLRAQDSKLKPQGSRFKPWAQGSGLKAEDLELKPQ